MLGTNFTKIKPKNTKELSLKDILSIIQACECSKVQSFELNGLKITFSSPDSDISAIELSNIPNLSSDQSSNSDQPKPNDSFNDDLADHQLMIQDPLKWESKFLGQE